MSNTNNTANDRTTRIVVEHISDRYKQYKLYSGRILVRVSSNLKYLEGLKGRIDALYSSEKPETTKLVVNKQGGE